MSDRNQSSIPWPSPGAAALWHSEKLARLIRRQIDAADGWLDFSEYMDLVLYAPGQGYYSAGTQKFGAAGDFVTAPEISGLFPACLARVCAESLAALSAPQPVILEVGAGSGTLAAGLLEALQREQRLPARYLILEVSADLRARQRECLAARVPDLLERVDWLDTLPREPVVGVIVANEVLDALPVTRFGIGPDSKVEVQGVALDKGALTWRSRPADEALQREVRRLEASIGRALPPGYVSELAPGLPGFISGLSRSLAAGVMLLVDYGLPRREYYSPERSDGTLACHYRHRRHADPFLHPGLQDITAWVDFTHVAESADAAGSHVLGFTTQANFLLAAGIDAVHAEQLAADPTEEQRLRLSSELQQLMMPGQMGEHFKVLALGRGSVECPAAVAAHDLLHLL